MTGEIRLTVDEGRVADAGRFFAAGTHLLALLDEVSENAGVEWEVADLHLGCAIAALRPHDANHDVGINAARSVVRGLKLVREGEGLPEDWTPDVLTRAKDLVGVGFGASSVEFDGDVVWFDEKLKGALEQQSPWVREFYGTIRGKLTGVNVTRGNRATIQPQTGGKSVRVGFDRSMENDMKAGLLDFVEIDGRVKQDDNGRNYYISADVLRIVEDPAVTWQDVRASITDFTDGMSIEAYLELLRGEE